jgi:hypothetical protein
LFFALVFIFGLLFIFAIRVSFGWLI